jgi:hypothetical protein
MDKYAKNLTHFDEAVKLCPDFERKGKTMPYTSANGYMFGLLNKAGQLGIRMSKNGQEAFKEKYDSNTFKSYGATMKDYVLIPDSMAGNIELFAKYLKVGYDYVMSLKSK